MIYINMYSDDSKEGNFHITAHKSKNAAIRSACEQYRGWFWYAKSGYIKTQAIDIDTFERIQEIDLTDEIEELCDQFNEALEPFEASHDQSALYRQSA